MHTMQNLVVVSNEIVQCDHLLMVVFTDEHLTTYTCWKHLDEYQLKRMRFLTHEQLVEVCRDYNCEAKQEAWLAHDIRQSQTLGWDYRQRGYR